jgi:hypothetical protein
MTRAQRREVKLEDKRKRAAAKVTRRERRIVTGGQIFADVFYPMAEAQAFIGLGNSQTWEHINAGHLPPPVAPCEGSSARGWYGRTLQKIQAEREAAAAAGKVPA